MKNRILIGLIVTSVILPSITVAQKKVQKFSVSNIIKAPADKVWKVIGEDYGAIANSHPAIIKSNYISGSLKAGEGAQRVCYFNEKGTKFINEKQVNYDPTNYTFKNKVSQVGKMPMDPESTFAIYRVEPIDEKTSRFTLSMEYRTKPAFMGAMAKGSFKKLMNDYAIAIEHHLKTGENVNKDNFKGIKKQYKENNKS